MYSEEIHDPHLTPNCRWVNKDGGRGGEGMGHVAQIGEKKQGGRVQEGDQSEGTRVMGQH
jgi:hypothetical protein